MKRIGLLSAALMFAFLPALMTGTESKTGASHLTAAQIVDKNVAARGGLAAWRSVKTLEMKGKMDAGGNGRTVVAAPGTKQGYKIVDSARKEPVQLPFVMELERGRKVRLEIEFEGKTAVQVYNGSEGWKLRPFLNRHQVENFTEEELKAASAQSDLDGLLIDYAAKGSQVALEGMEPVEGRDAYKLKVTDKSGHERRVWVDAGSFLEVKIEGTPRRLDGKNHAVATYLRNYKSINGLVMPYLIETAVDGVTNKERIQIESIVSNPKLDDSQFAMPR